MKTYAVTSHQTICDNVLPAQSYRTSEEPVMTMEQWWNDDQKGKIKDPLKET
jgi:hypothetical protein